MMSLQPKLLLSPKQYRKISLFNDSMNIRTTRNSSFDIESCRKRSSNKKFKNSGSVLRSSKANDFSANLQAYCQQAQNYFRENNFSDAAKMYYDCVMIDPMHYPSRYMLGVCYFQLQRYEKCNRELQLVRDQQPKYNKNLYIIMALSFKKMQNFEKAIKTLEDALKSYQDCYDVWLFKGKLEMKMRRLLDCEDSFVAAVKSNPKKAQGYVCLGDCQRLQNQFERAIKNYSQALKLEEHNKNTLLKLTVCYYEMGQYQTGLMTVDQYLSQEECSSEANKLKGQLLLKLGKKIESQLYFEQAIQANNSKFAVSKSLIEIAKLKIESKDFYSLYHTLQRKEYLDYDISQLQPYILFSDGVFHMMKKQFEESWKYLIQLRQLELPFVINQIYLQFLSYVAIMLHNFDQALLLHEESDCCLYNQYLCKGILQFNEIDQALLQFQNALQFNNIDPNMYIAILKMKKSVHENNIQLAFEALLNLQQIKNYSNSQLQYLITLANCLIGNFQEALESCIIAIEKADENIADHYYLKGLILAEMGQLLDAIQEFSICLGIDNQYIKAFLLRSKCYAQIQETQQAFEDMNQFVSQQGDDYFSAGNLLFNQKMYNEALKTYQLDKQPTTELKLAICQCLLMTNQYEQLYQMLESPPDIQACAMFQQLINNQTTIETINKIIKQNSFLFQKQDLIFYKGIVLMYDSQFSNAIQEFERCVATTKSSHLIFVGNYNLMLCWMLLKKFKYALTQLENLMKLSDQKQLFMAIKQLLLEQSEFLLQDLSQGIDILLTNSLKLKPFVSTTLKYSIYPYVNLPSPKPKEMDVHFDITLITGLNALSIEVRPEAPWIRRNIDGVVFTDNIQNVELEQTDCSTNQNKRP